MNARTRLYIDSLLAAGFCYVADEDYEEFSKHAPEFEAEFAPHFFAYKCYLVRK